MACAKVFELYIPKNFPYLPETKDKESIGGIETFKLFATSQEADFSSLLQEGIQSK
jgi:hypothetical protein